MKIGFLLLIVVGSVISSSPTTPDLRPDEKFNPLTPVRTCFLAIGSIIPLLATGLIAQNDEAFYAGLAAMGVAVLLVVSTFLLLLLKLTARFVALLLANSFRLSKPISLS